MDPMIRATAMIFMLNIKVLQTPIKNYQLFDDEVLLPILPRASTHAGRRNAHGAVAAAAAAAAAAVAAEAAALREIEIEMRKMVSFQY